MIMFRNEKHSSNQSLEYFHQRALDLSVIVIPETPLTPGLAYTFHYE